MLKSSFLDKPVFICGHRKTGTTLLVNLFDNNKECMTIPGDNGFFYLYYPYLINASIDKKKKALNECNNKILKEIKSLNLDKKNKINLIGKYKLFIEYLKFIKKEDNFSTILKIRAYYFAKAFQKLKSKIWVEKTSSTEIYATQIKKKFKNAKFIHIIRDPRDNWASLKSGWKSKYNKYSKNLDHLMFSLIFRAINSFKFAILNQKIIGKKSYLIIKYEDLIINPKKELKKIKNFLSLSREIDLKTTILNFEWKSNNFIGKRRTKISKININKYLKLCTKNEIKILEFYFYDYLKKFRYKVNYNKKITDIAASMFYKKINKTFFQ